jgi:hypothetical protein
MIVAATTDNVRAMEDFLRKQVLPFQAEVAMVACQRGRADLNSPI